MFCTPNFFVVVVSGPSQGVIDLKNYYHDYTTTTIQPKNLEKILWEKNESKLHHLHFPGVLRFLRRGHAFTCTSSHGPMKGPNTLLIERKFSFHRTPTNIRQSIKIQNSSTK